MVVFCTKCNYMCIKKIVYKSKKLSFRKAVTFRFKIIVSKFFHNKLN